MKIKVSKVFAKFINDTAKKYNKQFAAGVTSFSPGGYGLHVGDIVDACTWGDWNDETGRGRAIIVTYPGDFYACPRYLSTAELNRAARRYGVRDAAGLEKMILDLLCI